MKQCTKCGQQKEESLFYRRTSSKDGLASQCKVCSTDPNRTWFQRNKQYELKRRRLKVQALIQISHELKTKSGCVSCGETEAVCLDWHHVTPTNKQHNVATLIDQLRTTAFYEEIAKCVVLCSNCHKKVHAGIITQTRTGEPLLL